MVSKILSAALLAGAASASCPLSVEITGTEGHVVNVAITNTASEPVTVFRGNTVLSPHATKDLLVTDADDNDIKFSGTYVSYKATGMTPDMFQTLAAGETVTSSVNAARTYDLSGVSTAKVSAIQGFYYTQGSETPTSLKDMTMCEDIVSDAVEVTPDQATAAADKLVAKRSATRSRVEPRSISYSSCSSSKTSQLKTTVKDAVSMAKAAATAAKTGSDDYYTQWFKSTSTKSKVSGIYSDVASVESNTVKISCTDTYNDCSDGSALLYTVPDDWVIVPCPNNGYWSFPEFSPSCSGDDYDRAGAMLHEMTHLFGTDDYAYGPTAAAKLSAARAAANADSYEMYAESVRLGGCTPAQSL